MPDDRPEQAGCATPPLGRAAPLGYVLPAIGAPRPGGPVQDDQSLQKYIAEINASSCVTTEGMAQAVTLLNASLSQTLARSTFQALDVKPHEHMDSWAASADQVSACSLLVHCPIFQCRPFGPSIPLSLFLLAALDIQLAMAYHVLCTVLCCKGERDREREREREREVWMDGPEGL